MRRRVLWSDGETFSLVVVLAALLGVLVFGLGIYAGAQQAECDAAVRSIVSYARVSQSDAIPSHHVDHLAERCGR